MKKYLAPLLLALLVSFVPAQIASANQIADGVCQGLNIYSDPGFDACETEADGGASAADLIANLSSTIVNLFSVIIGAVAVIMLIYGGFRYITSAGNQEKVQGAKNTILYALIGLLIVIFAQAIIRFVVSTFDNIA